MKTKLSTVIQEFSAVPVASEISEQQKANPPITPAELNAYFNNLYQDLLNNPAICPAGNAPPSKCPTTPGSCNRPPGSSLTWSQEGFRASRRREAR